jgi:ATP-dependent DNA ligase
VAHPGGQGSWRRSPHQPERPGPHQGFHAIVEALAALKPKTFTLDGEVAVFDAELVSRFEWLRDINHGDLATPPLFMVFDLLPLGAKDYRSEPLKVRRRALEKLVKGQALILPARRPRS